MRSWTRCPATSSPKREGPGLLEMEISDEGVGATEAREGSLGYGLVRKLAERIGDEIEVDVEDGVPVKILFPDPLMEDAAEPTLRRR
jgi:two-component sensor histidine kinase